MPLFAKSAAILELLAGGAGKTSVWVAEKLVMARELGLDTVDLNGSVILDAAGATMATVCKP
ncbi:MAG: hypothetical protein J6T92_02845 [Ottowia sp.]|nr:hypothetical protein [Ottowia sp.]